MGGGGNSRTTSTGESSYPQEFKPLAQSAVQQIQALQGSLPLQNFAQANPQSVAGVAPFQQAAMNMLPNMLNNTWGLQQMQNMNPAFNAISSNATRVGNASNPVFGQALQALASGGFGTGQRSFPGMTNPQFATMQAPAAFAPPNSQTIMGPGTGALPGTLSSQLARPIPNVTPAHISPVVGPYGNPSAGSIPQPARPGWNGQMPATYVPPPSGTIKGDIFNNLPR